MIDSSTSARQTVLALDLPQLPGATIPVVGAVYGVPKRIHDQTPDGCAVVVDSYLGQEGGDTVAIFLNGSTIAAASKETQGIDDAVTLNIPKGVLLPGRVNTLIYTVRRGSDNLGTSPTLEILYNSIRPGNQDRDPGLPGHSELQLLLPDEISNGVGPGFTVATVCVAYPYCRAYDEIRLNCNGKDLMYQVGANEAPPPPEHGSAAPTTVCFTVTRDDLGEDHPEFKFSYTVTDQLGNTPDVDSIWSATQTADVDLAGRRLPAPIPREDLTDNGDDPSIIDLEKLGIAPLSLIVLTSDPRFQQGDTIVLTYVAKIPGQPDINVTALGTVETEFGQTKPCILQVDNDKVIPGSKVEISYELFRGTVLVGSSRTARATVFGEAIPDEKPLITRVDDSRGEIPDGGRTFDTRVMLTGTASKGYEVEVFDGLDSKGTAMADAQTGVWALEITNLSIQFHSLTAKALYGDNQISEARTFTVLAELVIDTTPVYLNGFFLYIGQPRNATPMPADTIVTRTPITGNPGYTYYTSNGDVARVNGYGTVEGRANGQATITVADASGQTASYVVIRSNAWQLAMIGSITGGAAPAWANAQGAANSFAAPPRPDGGTMEYIRTYYVVPTGFNYRHWTGAFEDGNPLWPLWANPYTGEIGTQAIQDYLGAYCRIPFSSGHVLASIPES
ncbi:Ig-like domain-containing protein [Pseudomonas brassicacearum]|uniref:Ig-like domain-containing protein n=1 Tax=Pseudomonas brassicacearum TaxID=930166 RepID=UPI001296EBCA|nr:Ig-like domain-containing protein [Pseudomonas brassicacearum]QGA50988.1 Ig-like domain-containing protein [Pseudomonas brassicacearum]